MGENRRRFAKITHREAILWSADQLLKWLSCKALVRKTPILRSADQCQNRHLARNSLRGPDPNIIQQKSPIGNTVLQIAIAIAKPHRHFARSSSSRAPLYMLNMPLGAALLSVLSTSKMFLSYHKFVSFLYLVIKCALFFYWSLESKQGLPLQVWLLDRASLKILSEGKT